MKDHFEICFVGTPDGFECVSRFGLLDYKIQRILDEDTPRFGLTEFEILRVFQRVIDGETYKIVAIYSNAFEMKLQRGGGFVGTAFLYKNCFQENSDILISTLEALHVALKSAVLKNNNKFYRTIQSAIAEIVVPSLSAFKLTPNRVKLGGPPPAKKDLILNVSSGARFTSFKDCVDLIVEDNLFDKVGSIYGLRNLQVAVDSLAKNQDFVSLRELKLSSQIDSERRFQEFNSLEDRYRTLEHENRSLKGQLVELSSRISSAQLLSDNSLIAKREVPIDQPRSIGLADDLSGNKGGQSANSHSGSYSQNRTRVDPAVNIERKASSKKNISNNVEDNSMLWVVLLFFGIVLIVLAVVYVVINYDQLRKSLLEPQSRLLAQSQPSQPPPAGRSTNMSSGTERSSCGVANQNREIISFVNKDYSSVDQVVEVAISNCPPIEGCKSVLHSEFLEINGLASGTLEVGRVYQFKSTDVCKFAPTVFPPKTASNKR